MGVPRVSGARRSSSASVKPSPSASLVSTTTTSGMRVPTLFFAQLASVSAARSNPASFSAAPICRCSSASLSTIRTYPAIRPAESSCVAQSLEPRGGQCGGAWLKVGGRMPTASRTRKKKDTGRKNAAGKRGGGPLAAIVLAAGKGTRMRSSRAKVLHELLGQSLVSYPIELARSMGADPVVAVLGHQHEAVEAVLLARFGTGAVKVVEQTEQRGTGHAVRLAMPALARFDGNSGMVMVLYGDVPLLRRETLEELVGTARRYGCLRSEERRVGKECRSRGAAEC